MKIQLKKTEAKKLLILALLFTGFWIAGVLIHELGHLIANELLGGKGGMIYYGYWPTPHGYFSCEERPEEYRLIVSLAGGIVAALFLFVFFWLPARIKKKTPIEIAVSLPIIFNLLYASAEPLFYYETLALGQEPLEMLPWVVRYIRILSAIIFLLFYTKRTIRWLKE